jgi:hypothetical protein
MRTLDSCFDVPERTDIFIEVVGWDHTGQRVKMTENPVVGELE